ncbi:hypothetical protein BGZ67_004765, partial [Mortierella alpina]
QLLGEIAVDDAWESCIREQAVSFLGDLYLNDADWALDDSVRSWMLTILGKISEMPDRAVREVALLFLQGLMNNGSDIVTHPYPLRSHLPVPMKSPLLALVHGMPYLEYDLNDLRLRRLQEYSQTVYIPPLAKANLQAPDEDAQPLMKSIKEFLESDGQVFLVLGDSGAGKSTFNIHLEQELWSGYKPGGHIPLFINLPAVAESYRDIIGEQLRIHRFKEDKIKELKENRTMILICDGYDETQLKVNLHSENMLNQKGRADTKMIISCRSTYLGQDYRDQFRPQQNDRYSTATANLYTEAAIVPFSRDQIEDYIDQFVRDPEVHNLLGNRPIWTAKDYMNKLKAIPNLMELVRNPFLLSLSLRALPVVVKDAVNLAKVKVTRLRLYDSFIDQWLDINKIRLTNSALPDAAKSALQELREENFTPMAIEFLKNLAAAIYREQDGNPVVHYSPKSDKGTWKSSFFGSELDTALLRESSPLSRAGIQHRFIHRSLLEYFYSRHVYEANEIQQKGSDGSQPLANDPLSQKILVKEPPIVQFLAEYVQGDSAFEQRLHGIVERSKTNVRASRAAANAITILVRAGILFNGANLQGIQISGANLSGGQFDSAQLQGADLRNTNLRNIWLRQAVLSNALMGDVEFGESAYLEEIHSVLLCAYSQDGKTLALGLSNNTISLYDTATWEKTCELTGHTSRVTSVVFSPTDQQLASGSNDWTVRLWDIQTGASGAILSGHTSWVTSVVFSRSGKQIASGSSDKTVRLWDAQTGAPRAILCGHTFRVTRVVFSPNGQQLASGSLDNTVRLWDTQTGGLGAVLCGHTKGVTSVVFSPSGKQIASGSEDNTVRLWDTQSGAPGAILNGHTDWVTSVVFSPDGQQIASSSDDNAAGSRRQHLPLSSRDHTVRLWDAQTGTPGAILRGHTGDVTSVVFSPSGQQIASGSSDNIVRLWDARTGAPGAILNGHTDWVTSVVFSPSGQQIASSSWDKTVRLWDAQTGAPGAILSGHNGCVRSVVNSPSGQQIASGSTDGTIRLWDAQTGSPGAILSGHTNCVYSSVFSPSGQQIASGGADNKVRLWDAHTGAPGAILSGHTSCVMSVAFSPNGQQIVSGSGSGMDGERSTHWRLGSRDYTVRLWDAQTGTPGAILNCHTERVMSVVYSPNGQLIASGSDDETVRLWNAQTGAPGAILRGHTKGVTSVVFSPSGQQIASANLTSDGNDGSISPQGTRKRDILRNIFRSTKPADKVRSQASLPQAKIRDAGAASTHIDSAFSSLKVDSSQTGSQLTIDTSKACLDIFSENVGRTSSGITLPRLDARIDSTSQLALCISLLPRNTIFSSPHEGLERTSDSDPITNAVRSVPADGAEQEWIEAIDQDPLKQERIRWLGSRIVEEFVKDAVKNPVAVSEVILLGSVLDQALYRKLLNCFIEELSTSALLDLELLQGLVQLVQSASPTYLDADDLIKILSFLRKCLEDTHQQSSEHQYHLTLAVSRLLDVMAEPEHKVSDLPRVEEKEPLASVLSGLQSSSDPYLMYQALYAFQALQYVPDDESVVQAVMRHSLGAAESLIKVSGVIQLNFDGLLDGLKQMQKTLEETYGIAKSRYEGVRSLIDSGHGLFDSLRKGLVSGHKQPWYPAVVTATALCRAGQLDDFGKLVREAPCRRDPRFQWGVSQLLGEIATDLVWESSIREQAVKFLGDLYLNDADWGQDESVKSWMLTIIGKISETSCSTVQEASHTLLQVLKKDDAAIVTHSYPLRSHLPIPATSPLLTLVQKIPYVEDSLNNLRLLRLQEYTQTVYIPPQAKTSLQASNKDTLPLMEKIKDFLDSDGQVFLVLGDSGAGKSTFNRYLENELWKEYKQGARIPLFINLPAINNPCQDVIGKQLRIHYFSEAKIKELKKHRQILLICDGYDEAQLNVNLHTANMLNRKGKVHTKMIISCRSTYIGQDYRDQFQPQHNDRYTVSAANLYTEAVIVPFSSYQIEDYVRQFVRDPEVHKQLGDRPIWRTEDYMDKLKSIPNLMELVKNPFLLSLSLRALPNVVKGAFDLAKVNVTRLTLYDSFIDQWMHINKLRLRSNTLPDATKSVLKELLEGGFTSSAINFSKDLAAAIFLEQDGNPVVKYTPRIDKGTWKVKFFGSDPDTTLLRESSPLSRTGVYHRFIHRSLLEYFYSRHVYDANEMHATGYEGSQGLAHHPLNQRNLVKEPSIIQFLAERVQDDDVYKEHLLAIVEKSKTDLDASQAASNAITILVRAGVKFNGADLQGIQIPGADLSGGQFDSAQLQGSDLRNTNLRNIWLRQADLSNAQMEGVQFGESPFLKEENIVRFCEYSRDGKTLALGIEDSTISLYDTATWDNICRLTGHTSKLTSIVFSPTGQQIASASEDETVRLWDAQTGASGVILRGHTESVEIVVFSPTGQQIASGSSDNTVRLWDAQTGALDAILSGHTDDVTSVVFSPSGQQIASSSDDRTVQLWNAQTGALDATLSGHNATVWSVVFSPNGQQIASGSNDRTVRLWDARTGALDAILRGHTSFVLSVVFSPSGQQIASSSDDRTVRLWDTRTGALSAILRDHTEYVTSVVFSPSGHQIASSSHDGTVRLWDAQTGAPSAILSGHTSFVTSVVFSPSGQQIASCSKDKTVRLWDAQSAALGAIISGHTDDVTSVVFSPSGQQIASSSLDRTVRLWDSQTGALGAILSGHASGVLSVAFSPSGKQIASGSHDNTVRLWDAQTGAPGAILSSHTDDVMSVAFSPSGHQVASGSLDRTVRLWDAQTGVLGAILSGHASCVLSVAFSPSGQQIASGSYDNTVRLWDAQTGAPGAILSDHTATVWSVVFSPNGQQIASGSSDNTVRLWDAQTGAPAAILFGHISSVVSVVFSPNGQQIASGSFDKTVLLWDVKSGHCLATIDDFHGEVNAIAWNEGEDGSYIATGCDDKSVRLWKVMRDSHSVQLFWSSGHDQLVVSDANISNAQGLSRMNLTLLAQRGAVNESLSLREP